MKDIYNKSIVDARIRVLKDSYLRDRHRRSSYSIGQNTRKSIIQGTETNWPEPKKIRSFDRRIEISRDYCTVKLSPKTEEDIVQVGELVCLEQ